MFPAAFDGSDACKSFPAMCSLRPSHLRSSAFFKCLFSKLCLTTRFLFLPEGLRPGGCSPASLMKGGQSLSSWRRVQTHPVQCIVWRSMLLCGQESFSQRPHCKRSRKVAVFISAIFLQLLFREQKLLCCWVKKVWAEPETVKTSRLSSGVDVCVCFLKTQILLQEKLYSITCVNLCHFFAFE